LDGTRAQLDLTQLDILVAQKELETMKNDLEFTRVEVDKAKADVEAAKAEVEAGRQELGLSAQEIESQRLIIENNNMELGHLRIRLQDIAVLRVETLNQVKKSIEDKVGTHSASGDELVTIGDNANIVINETLVFDYGSAEVKEEAKQLLAQFALAFEELLDDAETREYIDMINIEGHTDSRGSAGFNRSLSSERAVAVVNYMMDSNPRLEEKYARYFGVTGFSKFRPIVGGEDEDSMQLNRRIEISVIIKDSNISKVIDNYLQEVANPPSEQ
jgi:chemotaxis protein MotB